VVAFHRLALRSRRHDFRPPGRNLCAARRQWPHSSYMVPGGVMSAPTLTDVTRAWSILEHFRRNWMEPMWLGCSLERYERSSPTRISSRGSTNGRSTRIPI